MPTTTPTPTHTENGEAFEPITEDLHAYGEDPDARVPESAAELSEELGRLAGELHDVSLILRRVSSHFEEKDLEEELGTIMAAERIADRFCVVLHGRRHGSGLVEGNVLTPPYRG
ncbi:hypothetical protein [Salinibacter ruber]|uniref:hypothetical protein n=1 Tax=Salinibacter ruber TaxID=146919 RepID=UPI000E569C7F|nr:hypothetical protein [Salinibacter ruber]